MVSEQHWAAPAGLNLSEWPVLDLQLWTDAKSRISGYQVGTQRLIGSEYGRFLRFLAYHDNLDLSASPSDRFNAVGNRYAAALCELGLSEGTIRFRLWGTQRAIRAMQPDRLQRFCYPRFELDYDTKRLSRPARARKNYVETWPELDRRLWSEGLKPRSLLDEPVRKPRSATIKGIIYTYTRWLGFLSSQGKLDPTVLPTDRVTHSVVNVLCRKYVDAGRRSITLYTELYRLQRALTIMQPKVDVAWIRRPGGRPLSAILPRDERLFRKVIDSRVLYEWGVQMMVDAKDKSGWHQSRVLMRDGLLICLLAARAPRLSSIARLQLGKNVVRSEDGFHLIFEEEDLKIGPALEYGVPAGLSAAVEHYLLIRIELLAGNCHDAFWVTQNGNPLHPDTIQGMVARRSKKCFGFNFFPHLFRRGIGTSAPLHDPAHPGIATALLNNSGRTLDKHYNVARASASAGRFHASLRRVREITESLARREFRRGRVHKRK